MLSEPMPCPKIKSGSRWDPDAYMDVDEVAYPEGHTLWDKVLVPGASKLTLAAFVELFKTQHKLVLQDLGFLEKVGGEDKMRMVMADDDAYLPKLLVDIIAEKSGKQLTQADVFCPLPNLTFETVDGDPVQCAPVVLQLDW